MKKSKTFDFSVIRLLFLLLVLLVFCGLLGYDRLIARHQPHTAADKLDAYTQQAMARADTLRVTKDEVQKVVGRKPGKLEKHGDYDVEIYEWRAGNPFRTYKLFTMYNPDGRFEMCFTSREEMEERLDGVNVLYRPNQDNPNANAGQGQGGPDPSRAGRGPGGAGPSGRGPGGAGPGGMGRGQRGARQSGRPQRPRGEDPPATEGDSQNEKKADAAEDKKEP